VSANSKIERYATAVLGPISQTADLTRRAGRVLVVADGQGRSWVLKTVPTRAAFERELNAYTHWVPHFVDQAPRLQHADHGLRTLILEHLPGYTDWTFDPADHFAAGRLLQRIHTAAPARWDGPDVGTTTDDNLAATLRRLPDPALVGAVERGFARAGVHALREEFGHLPRVPCHGDFGGHNWLRGADRMRVIDFSSARFNAAAADFARLFIGPWWERPDLVEAFFEGYGRPITGEELECVRLQLPVFAISLLGHGRRHGDREMERRGHYRLGKLLDGADFTKRPGGVRRYYHTVRRLARGISASGAARLAIRRCSVTSETVSTRGKAGTRTRSRSSHAP